jgi:hypothetical protein
VIRAQPGGDRFLHLRIGTELCDNSAATFLLHEQLEARVNAALVALGGVEY